MSERQRYEIPIDDKPHNIAVVGVPVRVSVSEDRATMFFWTDGGEAARERTFQVYPSHPSLYGRMEPLPGDAVARGITDPTPDRWRWSLYELVRGRRVEEQA